MVQWRKIRKFIIIILNVEFFYQKCIKHISQIYNPVRQKGYKMYIIWRNVYVLQGKKYLEYHYAIMWCSGWLLAPHVMPIYVNVMRQSYVMIYML